MHRIHSEVKAASTILRMNCHFEDKLRITLIVPSLHMYFRETDILGMVNKNAFGHKTQQALQYFHSDTHSKTVRVKAVHL